MIKTNKGHTQVNGTIEEVLTDVSMIIEALTDSGIPKHLLKEAIKVGFNPSLADDVIDDVDDEDFKKILKNLGLED